MISTRTHLEMLRRADRERTNILVTIPTALFVWLYYELGRRQTVTERREDGERKLVHGELATLREATAAAKERAAGAAEAEKARRERTEEGWKPREHLIAIIGTAAIVATVIVTIFAYHLFG